jgi:hypothetical protein
VTRRRLPLLAGLLMLSCQGLGSARAETPRLYAGQVPGGGVRVLVVITEGAWPAGGLRIEDGSGAVLLQHLSSDPDAARALDAASQTALAALLHSPASSAAQAKSLTAILALRLVSDWGFARAAGAGVELPSGVQPKSLRAVLLDASGAATSTVGPVTVPSDLGPPPATALHADATAAGIVLHWQTPARAAAVPAYAYTVERNDGARVEPITLHPQLFILGADKAANPFVDHTPPVETSLTYALRIVDVLGVPSAPAAAQVFSPDLAAAAPPSAQVAKAGRGGVTLTWAPLSNPRTGALMVERSQLIEGPYERLTPAGLSAQDTRFEDKQVLAGASYFYRVRAVTPQGNLGPPGDPVRAQPLGQAALAAPQGLQADIGASRIVLTWTPVPGLALAGYIIERRAAADAARWARLNAKLDPEPRFTDVIGPSQGGSFEYRVTAVATDEASSAPSAGLKVALLDTTPPAAPRLVSTSGADGRVVIQFAAAEPAAKTAQVALLRADTALEEGLIIGAPAAATAGTLQDQWVHAGQVYWYRLVAFDAAGNRSAATEAFQVRVAAATLTAPAAPKLTFTATPAPIVNLTFDAPPPHARVIVQVERDDGRWRNIAGPMVATSAVDPAPPGPHSKYRLVYVGDSGGLGIPSPAATP